MADFKEIPIPEESDIRVATGASSIAKNEIYKNEDNFFCASYAGGVFDGVGGSNGGEKASKIASDYLKQRFSRMSIPTGAPLKNVEAIVEKEMQAANYLVFTDAREQDSDGATTATLACIGESGNGTPYVLFANVGDSRGYVLRGGYLFQVTDDDNELKKIFKNKDDFKRVQDKLNRANNINDLSEEEQIYYRNRNKITNALGRQQTSVSFYSAVLYPGDQVILCTDGVSDNLTTEEMEKACRKGRNPDEIAKVLVSSARARSLQGKNVSFRAKSDDITVVVLKPDLEGGATPSEIKRPLYIKAGDQVVVKTSEGTRGGVVKSYNSERDEYFISCRGKLLSVKSGSAELESLNPITIEQVVRADNEKELLYYLSKFDGVSTSQGKFLTGQELADRARSVFYGGYDVSLIPRAGNLRQKVNSLIERA